MQQTLSNFHKVLLKHIDGVAQKGPICFFFLPRSKLIILINAELYFISGLSWFYQVSILQKNKFRKFVGIISSYNSDYGD